ncbi:MAG: hypothetical protein OXM55_06025 [Bdellovibrionales bacterium]|nr:hypothetical protein [Bdellovibrionales bacterium]
MKVNRTHFFSFFLMALVLFPVFVFLFKVPLLQFPASSEWFEVFISTLLQAGLSAFFSVLLGIFGALGLCAFSNIPNRYRKKRNLQRPSLPLGENKKTPGKSKTDWNSIKKKGLELFCLLPALLPPLIPVLAWINVFEFFYHFPFSFYSVLAIHICMNVGFTSVFFFRLFQNQTGSLPAWAFLHGVSRLYFLKKILFFEFRKDIILIFLLIFSFCFTSFSVPLLIGGVSGQTMEVFIAEKLKDPATWPEAMALFTIETVFIFIFFILLYGREEKEVRIVKQTEPLYLLPCLPFLILPVLPSLLIFLGLGDVFSSEAVWRDLFTIKESVAMAVIQTLFVGIGTGLLVLFLLAFVAFCLRDLFLRHFLVAYSGASVAFMGFAFLLIGSDGPITVGMKWSVGLALLFLPTLYRLMGESLLRRLKNQIQLADLMGASRGLSFIKVIWPQCAGVFFFLSGIAAFWACGDFAYSSIVAGEQTHLALLIQDLFSSYRFELATVLTWFLILSGTFCFSLFAGGAFVLYKKSYL